MGGRFSVLSPVGLVPLAFAGVDTGELLAGAADARAHVDTSSPDNEAVHVAALRHALYRAGFTVDVLSVASPRLRAFAAWWQQLFGESEGKNHRGPFPAVCELPSDLHSLGQFLQDGTRHVAETFLTIRDDPSHMRIPKGDARDRLDYLEGRSLAHVLDAAVLGTIDAHATGGVPVLEVELPARRAGAIGAAFYFFEVVVAISALLLDVNPFDQPGVEAYKRNMFTRLGKR